MKQLGPLAIAVLLCLLARTVTARGIVYISDPDPSAVTVGDTFAIEVRGKDFLVPLDGGGVNISFSSLSLRLLDVEIAPMWDFSAEPDAADIDGWNQAGTVSGLWFNTFSMAGVTGDFAIAVLTFAAIAGGPADIAPEANDRYVFGRLGQRIDPDGFIGTQVAIAAVPEPGTWAVLATGLLLLTVSLRRGMLRPWPRGVLSSGMARSASV